MKQIKRWIYIHILRICPACHGHLFRWALNRIDCEDCSEKYY